MNYWFFIYQILREIIHLLPCEWLHVQFVTADFDGALLWGALWSVFLHAKLQGCPLHWTQLMWKKVNYECKELNTCLLVSFVFALWDFCMLVHLACGIYFSVLVKYFIVVYLLVSKGCVSLFGSVFSLAISKQSFFALQQPDFMLQFVAAPVQFFPSSWSVWSV